MKQQQQQQTPIKQRAVELTTRTRSDKTVLIIHIYHPLTTSFLHLRGPLFPAAAAAAVAVADPAAAVVVNCFVFLLFFAPGEARDRCLTRTRQLIPGAKTLPHLLHMESTMHSGRPAHPVKKINKFRSKLQQRSPLLCTHTQTHFLLLGYFCESRILQICIPTRKTRCHAMKAGPVIRC